MWRPLYSHFSNTIGRRVIADKNISQWFGNRKAVTSSWAFEGQRLVAMVLVHVELGSNFLHGQA